MSINKWAVVTRDNTCVVKTYQTVNGAKLYVKRLNELDKKKVKIIPIGSNAGKYISGYEAIVK